MCQGYYRHSEGYTPDWEGMDDFKGRIVHPQTWPDDLDYTRQAGGRDRLGRHRGDADPGDRGDCAHVTMLQRSPTYFRAGAQRQRAGRQLRELEIDETWIHEIVRRKILHDQDAFTRRASTSPRR